MRPTRTLRLGVMLLTVLNMTPVLEADGAWWILALAMISGLASLALRPSEDRALVPGLIVLLGVLASVGYSLIEMLQPQTVYILALAHFIIFLACCKFFELRTYRDLALVGVIAFLLLIIAAFVSASPVFGMVLLIDGTCGLAWLMRLQADRQWSALLSRRRAALAWAGASGGAAFQDAPLQGAPWRSALLHGVGMIFVAGVIFVAVPRAWGRGLLARIQRAMPLVVTGFSDEIQLSDATIVEDPTLVMRAKFSRNGRTVGGDDFQPYMRGITFDRYRNGQWRRTRPRFVGELQANRDGAVHPLPLFAGFIPREPLMEVEVWLESLPTAVTRRETDQFIFSLYPPVAFASKDLRRIQQAKADLTLETDDQARTGVSYWLAAPAGGVTAYSTSIDSPPAHRDWSDYSYTNVDVWNFARDHFAQFGDASNPKAHAKLAAQVCEFLRGGEYKYSLERGRSAANADRVKDFLFNNKQGHCEYFASAMVLMCQAMNIPARLVSGYYGGEYNAVGGFYQFRAKDAHAWAEVWVPDRGWVTFDPSPSDSRRDVAAQSLWTQCRRLSDFMRFKWATMVVSFDASSRRELFHAFENWLRTVVEFQQRPASFWEGVTSLLWGPEVLSLYQRFFYWLLLILLVLFALLMVRVLWILSLMIRERWLRADHSTARLVRHAEARFYDRLLLLLANKGHVKPRHLTPREFARDLAAGHHDFADLPEFTDWFYQAQYARRPLGRDQWERLKAVLTRLREDPAFGAE